MNERDEHGKFKKGHSVRSPGRPKAPIEVEYLSILKQGVTISDWQKIVNTAVSLAMAGDYKAREWIANYLIGKPLQIIELKAADTLLLKQVIDLMTEKGIKPHMIFEAMLNEITQNEYIGIEAGTDEQ